MTSAAFFGIFLYLIDFVFMILAAVEFLRNVPEGKYDAIIVDSSDPVGMSLPILLFISWEFGCQYL